MEMFDQYSVGIISLLTFVILVLIQSALVGAGKAKAGLVPGSDPEANYDNGLYRLNRSHQNGVEIMAAAAVSLIFAILLGVSSWWVNVLMAIFLLSRVVYIVIYAQNMGKPTQGVRTFIFVSGWATLVVLCLMSIWKLL